MFTIIIILIVVLIIAAIFINAYQQHKAKVDAERRAELAKQKTIVDETENVLMAATSMPVSGRLLQILQIRVANALKAIYESGMGGPDIRQRAVDAENRVQNADPEALPPADFMLPDNDKMIIQYIQAVKKFRILLRSEHSRGKVESRVYAEEDKALERLQLKINVETLIKRGRNAMQSNMMGSSRQYFEKAVAALENQPQTDEYIESRLATLKQWLSEIQANLKSVNAQDRAKRQEAERDELDELFAPKKKW
ncbi:hypothetical protein IT774_08315 [Salinimonas marina]|uniref:DNA repair protein n=1 Tax=Salinimonas marina TaxID=2785918 RepID=A0A7S9HCC3_9ALTE|nr:hypothetical protein [Salinimonas marina]QPG04291.1 hypothetical protein IT774_08315 [Salinimonas marina]